MSSGPAKLSFGFSKHQGARRVDGNSKKKEEEAQREELIAVEGGVLKTAGQPAPAAKQFIVPKLENTFQTGVGNREKTGSKKFTPSFKPPDSSASIGDSSERFEVAKEDTRPKITEYGLQKRTRPGDDTGRPGQVADQGDGGAVNRSGGGDVPPAKLEEVALERDVQGLPEAAPVEVGAVWKEQDERRPSTQTCCVGTMGACVSCVCVHACMHMCTCTRACASACVRAYVCMDVHIACTYACMRLLERTRMRLHAYGLACVCACVHECAIPQPPHA